MFIYFFISAYLLFIFLFSFALYFYSKNSLHKISSMFVITCISEFSKRFIYICGDIDPLVYYLVLFIPDILIVYDIILSKSIKKPVLLLFLIVIVSSFLSILNSQGIGSLAISLRTIFYPFLISLISQSTEKEYLDYQKYFNKIIITIIISIIYSSYQFFIDYPFWEYNWDVFSPANMNITAISNFGTINRSFGFFSEVANQGVAISIVFLYIYYLYKLTYVKLLLLSILMFGLIITGSKAAIVSLFLVIPFFKLWILLKNHLIFLILLGFYLLSISRPFVYMLITYARQLFSGASLALLDPATLLARIKTIENFNNLMSPFSYIFGSGVGYIGGIVMDNLYLYIVYKVGIVGLLLFLFIVHKKVCNLNMKNKFHTFAFSSICFFLVFSQTSLSFTTRSSIFLMMYVWTISNKQLCEE